MSFFSDQRAERIFSIKKELERAAKEKKHICFSAFVASKAAALGLTNGKIREYFQIMVQEGSIKVDYNQDKIEYIGGLV